MRAPPFYHLTGHSVTGSTPSLNYSKAEEAPLIAARAIKVPTWHIGVLWTPSLLLEHQGIYSLSWPRYRTYSNLLLLLQRSTRVCWLNRANFNMFGSLWDTRVAHWVTDIFWALSTKSTCHDIQKDSQVVGTRCPPGCGPECIWGIAAYHKLHSL